MLAWETRIAEEPGGRSSATEQQAREALAVVFTDVEGSTRLWERFPDELPTVMTHHQELLSNLAGRHGGHTVKFLGDGVMAVFDDCAEAMRWALQSAARDRSRVPAALRGGLARARRPQLRISDADWTG